MIINETRNRKTRLKKEIGNKKKKKTHNEEEECINQRLYFRSSAQTWQNKQFNIAILSIGKLICYLFCSEISNLKLQWTQRETKTTRAQPIFHLIHRRLSSNMIDFTQLTHLIDANKSFLYYSLPLLSWETEKKILVKCINYCSFNVLITIKWMFVQHEHAQRIFVNEWNKNLKNVTKLSKMSGIGIGICD